MMHMRHDDPLSGLAGVGPVTATAEGKIIPYLPNVPLPEWFQVKTYGSKGFTVADQKLGDKFYQALAALTGRDVKKLFADRVYAAPQNMIHAIMAALQETQAAPSPDIAALVSYASGGGVYEGTFQTTSQNLDREEFLTADRMHCETCDTPIRYSDALLRLKKSNAAAHDYIVSLIGARAAKRKFQQDVSFTQDQQKVIKKELEIVEKTAKTGAKVVESAGTAVKGAAEGVASAFDLAGFLARNWLWIVGGTVVIGGYLLYRNRDTVVGRAARTALRLP